MPKHLWIPKLVPLAVPLQFTVPIPCPLVAPRQICVPRLLPSILPLQLCDPKLFSFGPAPTALGSQAFVFFSTRSQVFPSVLLLVYTAACMYCFPMLTDNSRHLCKFEMHVLNNFE
jgi:hypothetical protein